jgi:hypothetical protein
VCLIRRAKIANQRGRCCTWSRFRGAHPEEIHATVHTGHVILQQSTKCHHRIGGEMTESYLGGRDHPLIGCYRSNDPALIEKLRLPPARRKRAAARELILAEAIAVARASPSRWTSYSRRKAFYSDTRRYRARPLTFATVVPTIDELADMRYLEHEKARPYQLGWQSRYRATPSLLEAANDNQVKVSVQPHEPIILRDADRNPVDYRDTNATCRMRSRLREISEAIGACEIAIDGVIASDGESLPFPQDRRLPVSKRLHRVFNRGSFQLGGRLYGGFWQNLPKEWRGRIAIGGERMTELDYEWLHPKMLYAMAGKKLESDPYDMPGWERKTVKRAFNTMVNADSHLAAWRAIARQIGGARAFKRAEKLMNELMFKHAPVAHLFNSCAGLKLMRIDSDMAEGVVRDLMKKNIVALPIHDSFIVPVRYEGELEEAMDRALHDGLNSLQESPIITKGYEKKVPQYADKCVPSLSGASPPSRRACCR